MADLKDDFENDFEYLILEKINKKYKSLRSLIQPKLGFDLYLKLYYI